MSEDTDLTAAPESPESRLYAAGFTHQLEFWLSPDGQRVLNLGDAIAALDSGAINPAAGVAFPDTGVRALPDELVERIFHSPTPPPPPEWLESLAELVAEKLKPVVRAEVRAALRSKGARL
jgi:hypothetical protein